MRRGHDSGTIYFYEERKPILGIFKRDDVEWECEVTVHWYTDNSWGSDADGNRGVSRTEVDDVDFDFVTRNGKPVKKSKVPEHIIDGFQKELEERNYEI